MKAIIVKGNEKYISEVASNDIRLILSIARLHHGDGVVDHVIGNDYKYVLVDSTGKLEPIGLPLEMLQSDFEGFDTLFILEDISGNFNPAIVIAMLAEVGVAVSTTSAMVISAIANTVLSFAVSALMNMLSPTPEFNGDPSGKQKSSNLFNGGVLTREQGGSVPFLFGNCFCGGVVISAGNRTTDT